jgi:hypothetical protein
MFPENPHKIPIFCICSLVEFSPRVFDLFPNTFQREQSLRAVLYRQAITLFTENRYFGRGLFIKPRPKPTFGHFNWVFDVNGTDINNK